MRVTLLALAVALSMTPTFAAGPAPRIYRIDARVFSATSPADGVVRLTLDSGRQVALPFSTPGVTPPLEPVREIRVGDEKIVVDPKNELEIVAGKVPGIELMSAPEIVTEENYEAAIRTGSSVQYLAPAGDGHLKVETLDAEGPGLLLRITPKPSDGKVDVTSLLTLTTIAGRDAVPGVDLEIGRPLLNRMEMSSRIVVAPERWFLISGVAMKRNGHTDLVLLLMRVTEVGPPQSVRSGKPA